MMQGSKSFSSTGDSAMVSAGKGASFKASGRVRWGRVANKGAAIMIAVLQLPGGGRRYASVQRESAAKRCSEWQALAVSRVSLLYEGAKEGVCVLVSE